MSAQAVADPTGAAHARVPSTQARSARVRESQADAFPHTRRPLPWFLAGFIALVFLFPIDASELKVHIGVDSHPDRLAMLVLLLAWMWFGGDQHAFVRTRRSKLFVTAACIFLAVAVASLLFHAPRVIGLGELELSEKRFALLSSFLLIGWFALSALRFEDLRGFCSYLIGLAVVVAIGMTIERRTGYNVFYEWGRHILGPIGTVRESGTGIVAEPGIFGRVNIVGPTLHPLAATAMLIMVMPLALVRALDASTRRSKWLNGVACLLILVAAIETERKTALLAPVLMAAYVAWYRPRQMLRLAPLGVVVALAIVHVAAPGTLGTVLNPTAVTQSNSTSHREGDFAGVLPDVLAHPLLGLGYGSLDPTHPAQYRVNDDQYVDEIWQTGILGLLAFVWMLLTPLAIARPAIRKRGPTVASLVLATSAGCFVVLVVTALFDSMSFTEVPYLFFLLAAMTTIAAAGPEGNVQHAHEPARPPVRALTKRLGLPRRPVPSAQGF
jgi:hypothetical protein